MPGLRSTFCLALLACWLPVAAAAAPDVTDTRLLTQPALSASHIAFVYAADLWVSDVDGRNVRRLTSGDGLESNPAFSPDGALVAFSAQYDGNTDVYVVPVAGGVPTRLTWHPGDDVVQGFSPDGSSVLFTSAREVFTNRHTQLYSVSVKGGTPERLPVPHAARATWAPDQTAVAYNPLAPRHLQWKRYRGGTVSTIVIQRLKDHAVEKVPQPETRANDADPMWMGDTIYFRSDRNGEFNLFAYDRGTRAVRQLTTHADFPVLHASAGAGRIVYEQAGYLHLLDPSSGRSTKLTIGVGADLVERRPRFVKGQEYVRAAHVSPGGVRAVFEFRGEIVTVPAEKGDPRNLTGTPAVHERSPAWSPDGRWIAHFSDASGEYALHVRAQDGKGEPRVIELAGSGFYARPVWSPDSTRIAFADNGRTIWVATLDGKAPQKVATEPVYMPGPFLGTRYSWSPDSKWLVYGLNSRTRTESLYAWPVGGTPVRLTDGLSDVSEPVFDRSGKFLFLFGSTNAGPAKDWFSQHNNDIRATRSIYVMVLKKGIPSPVARQSDEEKGSESTETPEPPQKASPAPTSAGGGAQAASEDPAKKEQEEARKKAPPEPTVIELDDLPYRIIDLPIPPGEYSRLEVAADGQLLWLSAMPAPPTEAPGRRQSLMRFDFQKQKAETLLPDIDGYVLTDDGKKVLFRKGPSWAIAALGPKVEVPEAKLPMDRIDVRIDPPAEWAQMLDEAWRINRDYFYAPNMHGVDWPAMRQKYREFLPHLSHRSDLARVVQWMLSELAVGHSYSFGGDTRVKPAPVPGGLLGADFEIANGRYRFKKIYGGLNWNPQLRSPLTEPGVDAKAGEYLLAVNGQDLRLPTSVYAPFENTADRFVEITIGPDASGKGSRTVQVVPVASEEALRNRDWVEGNLRKVTEATKGRAAYVYVPNTANLGHEYFKRYFFPQVDREAIIVDERFNGGGQVADYYIDLLRRPLISYWHTRHGTSFRTPSAAILGPKVMLIDETAGSGGDLLPWMFRQAKLGPLVGKRTWGGLVGILGFPILMDGGSITAPNLAIWTEDGWIVENEGVPPDIDVEQTPADIAAGRDPQLERAIQIVLEELKKTPVQQPTLPPWPVR
jgi:tricorn protease